MCACACTYVRVCVCVCVCSFRQSEPRLFVFRYSRFEAEKDVYTGIGLFFSFFVLFLLVRLMAQGSTRLRYVTFIMFTQTKYCNSHFSLFIDELSASRLHKTQLAHVGFSFTVPALHFNNQNTSRGILCVCVLTRAVQQKVAAPTKKQKPGVVFAVSFIESFAAPCLGCLV